MGSLFYIYEFEIKTPTLVWQLCKIFSQESTFSSMELPVTFPFYDYNRCSPFLLIQEHTLSLLNQTQLGLIFLLCYNCQVFPALFLHFVKCFYLIGCFYCSTQLTHGQIYLCESLKFEPRLLLLTYQISYIYTLHETLEIQGLSTSLLEYLSSYMASVKCLYLHYFTKHLLMPILDPYQLASIL